MNKLTGEVKKFEDVFSQSLTDLDIESPDWDNAEQGYKRAWEEWGNLSDIADIYQQEFKPELIELFELEKDKHDSDFYWADRNSYVCLHNIRPYPQTLSDFIDACLNSGLKLTWRE